MKKIILKKCYVFLMLFVFQSCYTQNAQTQLLNQNRTYEVSAIQFSNNNILSVWVEGREEREVSEQISQTRIAYKFSNNKGNTWSNKKIIDDSSKEFLGNPFLISTENDDVFLIVMNVNQDFFSGNLAFYEWNHSKNEFELKSIPMSTKNSLLDKPQLAVKDDVVYLVYNEISEMLEEAQIKYQFSLDFGKTWSDKMNLTEDNIIYLGPSIKGNSNNLFFATGTYWQQKIYFSTLETIGSQLKLSNLKSIGDISNNLQSAMTTLVADESGNMGVGWLYNHKPNEVYVAFSLDFGENWMNPILLSDYGNLLSMTLDENGCLLALYSEFKDKQYAVSVKKFDLNHFGSIESEKLALMPPTSIQGELDYIGAYQTIMSSEENVLIFWIDFANENKLFFSKIGVD